MNFEAHNLSRQTSGNRLASLRLLLLLLLFQSAALHASDVTDPAWRNFQHALHKPAQTGANADHALAATAYRPIPVPEPEDIDPARFQLGFDLFHEGRLSSGNSIACVTCHAGALSGADRRQVSVGVGGARGTMNALSVFNAGFNFRQFWDGRAVTLEDQALEPIENPVEMANSLDAVIEMLNSDSRYPEKFAAIYPDGITVNNMTDALAHFQRFNFVRLDTPFQRHLNGDEDALDEQALRGWQRFDEIGCVACHNGINLGGNSYQQLGSIIPYYDELRTAGPDDVGVMARTGRDSDRHVFRVPGLHGVSSTPPYLHDGSVPTLEQAIELMARHQLDRQLSQQDADDIAAFLRSLDGRGPNYQSVLADESRGEERVTESLSHEDAWQAAREAVAGAAEQLPVAAQQIRSGEVANFDFLQFEHRELIRHARALHHPPSSLDAETRGRLESQAQVLLAAVNALEWLIAAFLRAEAMIVVLSAHPQPADVSTRLAEHHDMSRQALEMLGDATSSLLQYIP